MTDDKRVVLAVDGGNSKTLAAVCREDGELLGIAKSGGANFQSSGRKAASAEIDKAVTGALAEAGVEKVATACYGIAGADREKDFEIVREMIAPFDPAEKSELVNDTILALRAGTSDGVGVALIGGAGSNCIGMDRGGRIRKAWGLGPLTGDKANAGALVEDAIVEAMKGVDGRGPKTALEDKFKEALSLDKLEDIIAFWYVDSAEHPDLAKLAPLVFEAADDGDGVAENLLVEHGKAAGEAALAVMRDLFDRDMEVRVALGGSVLQKGSNQALIESVRVTIAGDFPRFRFIVLDDHPLLGGILKAVDMLGKTASGDVKEKAKGRLEEALRKIG